MCNEQRKNRDSNHMILIHRICLIFHILMLVGGSDQTSQNCRICNQNSAVISVREYWATRGPIGSHVGLLMSGREALTFLEENNLEVRARLTINTRKWLILVDRLANS